MKHISYLTCSFLLLAHFATAQNVLNPVHWTVEVKTINATTFDLVFVAKLEEGWELYSQFLESDAGPIPTTFIFQKHKNYKRIGEVKEGWANKKKEYDEMFDMTISKYAKSATFTQRIQTTGSTTVLIMIEFMACRSTSCLPARYQEFSLDLP